MSHEEILRKAYQMALDHGLGDSQIVEKIGGGFLYTQDNEYYRVIFNHDFAKALWGDNEVIVYSDTYEDIHEYLPNWQYHLQQMVIANDPIKYLGENI